MLKLKRIKLSLSIKINAYSGITIKSYQLHLPN
jgi:hypothetical protein